MKGMIILSEVTSEVQHITVLDFDITKAEQQHNISKNKVTQMLNNNNWKIHIAVSDKDILHLRTQLESTANLIQKTSAVVNCLMHKIEKSCK